MVTMLAMFILQQMWLCAVDCYLGYMKTILFASIAFDYLILIVKVNRSAKYTSYFLETRFFKLCFHGNS